jgi:DNA adenine methylase
MIRPPLRWVGGKQRYAPTIVSYIVTGSSARGRYFEPFLGGGAVFFRLRPYGAVLGDANKDLINFYHHLTTSPEMLWESIRSYDKEITSETYQSIREEFNSVQNAFHRAILFFVLNRTGFNGIWRVNRFGQYNVPFGYRGLSLVKLDDWLLVAKSLKHVTLMADDYSRTLEGVGAGDVVYLDPPYFDSTGREMFSRYTYSGFTQLDHERLADEFNRLSALDARVIMTVRDDPLIRKLYEYYCIKTVGVRNCVGARGKHVLVSDLIVSNFG